MLDKSRGSVRISGVIFAYWSVISGIPQTSDIGEVFGGSMASTSAQFEKYVQWEKYQSLIKY